jgi:acyl carrier protein
VAAVLGLADAAAVPPDQPLGELGLDSLMALEVRNQLSARAETTLPATLLFDYPTASSIARVLLQRLDFVAAPLWTDSEIRAKLRSVSIAALRRAALLDALMDQPDDRPPDAPEEMQDAIDQMDHRSVLQALDDLLK